MSAYRQRSWRMLAACPLMIGSCVSAPHTPLPESVGSSRTIEERSERFAKHAPVRTSAAPRGAASAAESSPASGEPEPAAASSDSPHCDGTPKERSDARCARPPEWPLDTRSLELRETAHVLAEPRRKSRYIGKITRGTRVAWRQTILGAALPEPNGKPERRKRAACPYWVNIEPGGFLCSDVLKPSSAEPEARRQPVVPPGSFVPASYYAVLNDGTKAYATPDDVRAGAAAEELSKHFMLVGSHAVPVDEVTYLRTDHGLVEQAALGRFSPSLFSGIDLRNGPAPAWPFAWLSGPHGARPTVYREPNKKAATARKGSRREVVSVLEERDGFVRIAVDEWVERSFVHVANVSPPPPDVASGEQWIDVDLDEQVLVAYEGKAAVFATLVSTGRPHHATPAWTYRVRAKAATTPMIGGEKNAPSRYEVSEVPWAVRFRRGLFIHAAYWHDAFGTTVSHGCVNVSPKDAVWLFDWVEPKLPDGWSEIEVPLGGGAIVRVRDREHPIPPPFDYSEEQAISSR